MSSAPTVVPERNCKRPRDAPATEETRTKAERFIKKAKAAFSSNKRGCECTDDLPGFMNLLASIANGAKDCERYYFRVVAGTKYLSIQRRFAGVAGARVILDVDKKDQLCRVQRPAGLGCVWNLTVDDIVRLSQEEGFKTH